MKIEGFIFNWKGHEAKALALEKKIERHIKVTVINSEERLSSPHPTWIHLDDTAYFSAQWNKAVELFDADILFHIQADVDCDDFEPLFARATSLWKKYRLGLYEPNIDVTIRSFRYKKSKLPPVARDVFKIPMPDCTCWFVSGDIVKNLPRLDLSINRYGWGVSAVAAAVCRQNARLCVRDYGVIVRHEGGRGYSSALAEQQGQAYIESLSPELKSAILKLDQLRCSIIERRSTYRYLRSLIVRFKTVRPIGRKTADLANT